MLHARKVGRVIARPFTGAPGQLQAHLEPARTMPSRRPRRRCWTGWRGRGGRPMRSARSATSFRCGGSGRCTKAKVDADLFEHLVRLGAEAEDGSLTFANFVEFDTLYGHPRDVAGYARALEWFDAGSAPVLRAVCGPGIWRSSPPIMAMTRPSGAPNTPASGCRWWAGASGLREVGLCGFVDVGATVAAHLGVAAQGPGRSFL